MFRRVLNRQSYSDDDDDQFANDQPNRPNRSNSYNGPEISIPSSSSNSTTRSRMRSFADRVSRSASAGVAAAAQQTRKRGRRPVGRSPTRTTTTSSATATNNASSSGGGGGGYNHYGDGGLGAGPSSSMMMRDSGGRSVVSNATTDLLSISTTITVETTRTRDNENRKPIPTYHNPQHYHPNNSYSKSHQVFCNRYNALQELRVASNDSGVNQIYCKDLEVDKSTCKAFLSLIRGDNKSWEVMAVDILRQRARWESITFEECSNIITSSDDKPLSEIITPQKRTSIILPDIQERDLYLEVCISFIISLDNCESLHLSNLILQQPFTLQSLTFTKHLTKLQFDLMDISHCIPTLCHCLVQNTSLETLITSRCGLDDDQLAAVLSSVPDQLLELRVFGNKCRSKGLAAAAGLIQTHPSLEILDLSYQHLSKRENPDDDKDFDVSWLMVALLDNTTLITLDLDNTAIDDNDLRHIVAALCENSTLEEIMLNHNFITNAGVELLTQRFNDMNGLKKISMYSNLFDPPTITQMPTEISTPNSVTNSNNNNNYHNNTGGGGGSAWTSQRRQQRGGGGKLRDFFNNEEQGAMGAASDDDRTINTAVSSLADETVFQTMMDNAVSAMPSHSIDDDEVPQEPYRADPTIPRLGELAVNDKDFFHRKSATAGTVDMNGVVPKDDDEDQQRQYFDDGNDYDESVAPTEYEEISVYSNDTTANNDNNNNNSASSTTEYPQYSVTNEDSMPTNDDNMVQEEIIPEPIPDADFVRSNTTTF